MLRIHFPPSPAACYIATFLPLASISKCCPRDKVRKEMDDGSGGTNLLRITVYFGLDLLEFGNLDGTMV
jgi:hypothetical protein